MQHHFFRQIDFLQSFFSHGTKSFAKKTFATSFFSVKLIFCKAFFPMGKKALHDFPIFRQIDGIMQNCGFYVNLTKKSEFVQRFFSHGMLQRFFAKLFVPWEKKLCKKSIWRKNWNCKGNFFLIVYLVSHIEITISWRLFWRKFLIEIRN